MVIRLRCCLQFGNLRLDIGLLLLLRQLLVLVLERLLLVLLLALSILVGVLLERIGANGLVCLGVQLLQAVGLNVIVDVALEL